MLIVIENQLTCSLFAQQFTAIHSMETSKLSRIYDFFISPYIAKSEENAFTISVYPKDYIYNLWCVSPISA